VRFVDGSGTVIKNGGRVMKNVTGYDLVKLLAGSRGTLGVLSEVSFKVQALPEAEATLIVEGFGDEAGLAALRAALGSPFDVSGAARHTGRSLIRVEGMAGSVAYRVARFAREDRGRGDAGRGGGLGGALARSAGCGAVAGQAGRDLAHRHPAHRRCRDRRAAGGFGGLGLGRGAGLAAG
jgi:FAD/FMN-containing dehydrogenase